MDPQPTPVNQPPVTPPTVPTPAPLVSPPSPQPVQPVTQAPAPVFPMSSTQTMPSRSSKKLLLIMVPVVLIIIIAALAAAWFLFFSPSAQSKRLSNSFMHSITTGDVAKATDLSGDSSAKAFLNTASTSVHGTYTLSESQFTGGKGYYLYTLSGAAKKYARTTVEENKGKRVVDAFVYSNAALKLIPSTSTTNDTTAASNTSPTNSPPVNSTAGCLTAADFAPFADVFNDTPVDSGNGSFSEFYQLEFNPDVATYSSASNPNPDAVFNDFKNFYATAANKKYSIELESSVNSATPDPSLANARNAKVQSDLKTISGIPASKITIMPISNSTSGNAGDSFYRQVQITLRSADSCSTN